MKPDCHGWAPGLNIPDGECVHCGALKRDHPRALQSRASGSLCGISPREFALADSPLAAHPSMISPASGAAKVRPDVVFCRACNQGMVIAGALHGSMAESDYACPKCREAGPKSKTPTGKPHTETHEMPKPVKTLRQRAFEDGLGLGDPVAPNDAAYMEWYAEGRLRGEADANAANAGHAAGGESILEADFEDVPVQPETVPVAQEEK